jgi:predicted ATPase/DNA-binding CsgD family transcriptional regulator
VKVRLPVLSNLPVQLTSFVGREAELSELRRLLTVGRLVTVAGTSGLGKTRLAVEVASRAQRDLPDGVWFVGLAALADPVLVAREVAAVLGAREQFGEPLLGTLALHVGARRMLLVLDNCEHLLDACARLAEGMLRSCSGLRILATSHEPLRVPGERIWRIAPLGLPDSGGAEPTPLETFAQSEAVRLFLARASLLRPQFTLSPQNAQTVARICQRLDGIPLAIELAAGRSEMMSVDDILELLEDRFRLLTGGSRTGLQRHQTLRAALDWGHHLLDDGERRLFRRLSVFPGGFELAAAEAVCADAALPAGEVLSTLSRLVDKSLVVPEAGLKGHTRYRMLETVRQYAAERMHESGEGDETRRRHVEHFLGVAEQAASFERRPGQAYWLERLESEHDDLRAALEWCRAHDAARRIRLTLALSWFWLVRGHLGEGREWVQGALAVPSVRPLEEAKARYWLSRLAFWQGDYTFARAHAERSLATFQELGEEVEAGWSRNVLGTICAYAGDDEAGQRHLDAVIGSTGDVDLRVDSLISKGELLLLRGELAAGRELLERSLSSAGGPDARWPVANGVLFLAIADFLERDYERARQRLTDCLPLYRQAGNRYALAGALDVFAGLALVDRDPERALRLEGAAAAFRDQIRAPLPPRWHARVRESVIEPARAAAGAAADRAWSAGGRMTMDEAVALALADELHPAPVIPLQPLPDFAGPSPLSRREREVALLVARGLTNRQVAKHLVIAERTVEGHLERIRGKLGVHSRTQIAVWVVERGWLGG